MKHLIICREYPPAPGGGIGTYAQNISRLLAESGETVHVIGEMCGAAQKPIEELYHGRLIIHRLPFEERFAFLWPRASSRMRSKVAHALYASDFPPRCFSWLAGALAERLVEEAAIDVIEAQDFEAPLYYFQLRRSLGLGPKRRPPCLVHLHSPTEFIARHNDWNMDQRPVLIAKQVENYSISTADALLCPSRFLARQAADHYELPKDGVEVIPYPLGDIAKVERDQATWSEGGICYIGRLERRKGVLDWIDAAIGVARQNADTSFEFVGANVLDSNPILSEALLDRLIPRDLKGRFVFHGKVHRSLIAQILKRARIAVVPSRWENFPNTCMEAMASGLPVIASPEGGMAEMIVDGQSGWIAERAGSAGLQKALARALQTPPAKIAAMGAVAAESIRQICGNQQIVEGHLSFRRRLVDRGAEHLLAQPWRNGTAAKANRGAGVTISDMLADYASSGLGQAADQSTDEAVGSDYLERFRQLVVDDTERSSGPSFISGNGWNGRAYQPLATIQCVIGKPALGLRVLRQVARAVSQD